MSEKKNWVQIQVRVELKDAENLRALAFAAHLPVAVFARELLVGRLPKSAPPFKDEMHPDAVSLMKMVQASINNLTQLAAACGASSSPILAKLAAEGGPLQAMKQQLADLGLRVKSGALAGAQASQILARLASPSDELNALAALARQVNQGAHGVPMGTWHAVLTALQTALTES